VRSATWAIALGVAEPPRANGVCGLQIAMGIVVCAPQALRVSDATARNSLGNREVVRAVRLRPGPC
jgi:hypothetical protein